MDNYKEYLDPKDGYALVKQSVNMPRNPDWIEIPEGTEIVRMNCEGSLNFYAKIDGHWAIKNRVDMENWYQPKPYSSHFDADDGSLPIIWERPTQDPSLIIGADALRALADGVDIQARNKEAGEWHDLDTDDHNVPLTLLVTGRNRNGFEFEFRLKPQTIKLELELPKPFEPKEGDTFYYLNDGEECGYVKCEHDWTFDPKELNFGAYRNEEEIKQVVEQLRKIRGTNS